MEKNAISARLGLGGQYPNQLIHLKHDTLHFHCPYCTSILNSRYRLEQHMWNFTSTRNNRRKGCVGAQCTEVWIQSKILVGKILDSLMRDFPKFQWKKLMDCIEIEDWNTIKE